LRTFRKSTPTQENSKNKQDKEGFDLLRTNLPTQHTPPPSITIHSRLHELLSHVKFVWITLYTYNSGVDYVI